jgi:hypothetical protein
MDQVERAGDGLERLIDGGIAWGLLLQHGQRMTSGVERRGSCFAARGTAGRFDAMQGAHGSSDGLGHRHHLRR